MAASRRLLRCNVGNWKKGLFCHERVSGNPVFWSHGRAADSTRAGFRVLMLYWMLLIDPPSTIYSEDAELLGNGRSKPKSVV